MMDTFVSVQCLYAAGVKLLLGDVQYCVCSMPYVVCQLILCQYDGLKYRYTWFMVFGKK